MCQMKSFFLLLWSCFDFGKTISHISTYVRNDFNPKMIGYPSELNPLSAVRCFGLRFDLITCQSIKDDCLYSQEHLQSHVSLTLK